MVALVTVVGPLSWLIKLALFNLIFHAFRPLAYIRYLVYIGIIVTGIYHVSASIANGILCSPKGGHDRMAYVAGFSRRECQDSSGPVQAISLASGAVNMFTDFYLLVIPLPAIYKLNLPTQRKAGVLFIFLTGAGYVHVLFMYILY
jgi:hypothetical protein